MSSDRETREYPDHTPSVARTVDIDGTPVDIIEHFRVIQDHRDAPVEVVLSRYEAVRAAVPYTLVPPAITFNTSTGQWVSASASRVITAGRGRDASLCRSQTIAGAITAARKYFTTQTYLTVYGPDARKVTRNVSADDFSQLNPDATIKPGDRVCAYGRGKYRTAIAVHVTRTGTVRFLFSTPTGGNLDFGTGKAGTQVRRMSPGPAVVAEAARKLQAELNHPAMVAALAAPAPTTPDRRHPPMPGQGRYASPVGGAALAFADADAIVAAVRADAAEGEEDRRAREDFQTMGAELDTPAQREYDAGTVRDDAAPEAERCSRCGDPIVDTNTSDRVNDDLCRDCRFEHDAEVSDPDDRAHTFDPGTAVVWISDGRHVLRGQVEASTEAARQCGKVPVRCSDGTAHTVAPGELRTAAQAVQDPPVWMSAQRAGYDYHPLQTGADGSYEPEAGARTGCGRGIFSGLVCWQGDVERELSARRCPRCP